MRVDWEKKRVRMVERESEGIGEGGGVSGRGASGRGNKREGK